MSNHTIVYKLLVFDRNTWNHTTVCKEMMTVQKSTIKKEIKTTNAENIITIKHV